MHCETTEEPGTTWRQSYWALQLSQCVPNVRRALTPRPPAQPAVLRKVLRDIGQHRGVSEHAVALRYLVQL